MYKLECEYSATRHAVFVRGSSELHHLLNVLPPLEVKAVDEKEWLMDCRAAEVSVYGQHPAVQSHTTTGGEGVRKGGREEGGGGRNSTTDRQTDRQTDRDRQRDK